MRLTNVLSGVCITNDYNKFLPRKLFWGFGKGFWGPRKVKYTWIKNFKIMTQRLGVKVHTRSWEEDNRPPGTVLVDANEFAAVNFYPDAPPLQHPWPFHNPVFVPKSKQDPEFKERPAFVYQKHQTLYEGLKGSSHFANAIIESEESLPPLVKDIESRITVDDKSLDLLNRRMHWTTRGDSVIIKMPKYKDFPRINYNKRLEFNIHPLRKDINILRTFQTVADLLIARRYGFVDRRIVDWPAAKIPFEREGNLCLLDLTTEFVTTAASSQSSESQKRATAELPVFDKSPEATMQKSLVDISPVSWQINFEETNFYPEEETWRVGINLPHRTQTIFLSNNNVNIKLQPDRFIKGRSVLYMYGMAVAQARQLYGSQDPQDAINYTDLPRPVTMQCVHYNMTKKNVVFLAFQLNTLSFNQDASLKNQIWTEGPFDAESDREKILKKLVALNLVGAHESVLRNVD